MVRSQQPCPDCHGTGKIIKEKCPDCYGTGYISSKKTIEVNIPAGIDNGQSVRIREKGEPGVNGGPRGDLLVEVVVSRHPIFQRQDMHIFSTVPITFAQAALGADIRIKTVDGEVIYTVKPGTKTDTKVRLKGKGGSTFVLPLERVSSSVQNFEISEHTFDISDMLYNANLALGKKVTVSGLEVDYGLNEPLAVDGNTDTRLSFARDKDEQWMIVDLGTVREINKVIIRYFERVSAYEIYVSEDGENYKKVYDVSGLEEGTRGDVDTVEFNTVNARYVKYVQLKRWYCADYSTYYSGGITEFEVYGPNPDHTDLISEAEMIDDNAVRTAVREINNYMKRKEIYAPHINGLYNALALAVDNYKKQPVAAAKQKTAYEM